MTSTALVVAKTCDLIAVDRPRKKAFNSYRTYSHQPLNENEPLVHIFQTEMRGYSDYQRLFNLCA